MTLDQQLLSGAIHKNRRSITTLLPRSANFPPTSSHIHQNSASTHTPNPAYFDHSYNMQSHMQPQQPDMYTYNGPTSSYYPTPNHNPAHNHNQNFDHTTFSMDTLAAPSSSIPSYSSSLYSSSMYHQPIDYEAQVSALAIARSRYRQSCRGRRTSANSKLQCNICGQFYSRRDNLRVHQRVHSGEKPYKCRQCGMKFRWLGALRTHEDSPRCKGNVQLAAMRKKQQQEKEQGQLVSSTTSSCTTPETEPEMKIDDVKSTHTTISAVTEENDEQSIKAKKEEHMTQINIKEDVSIMTTKSTPGSSCDTLPSTDLIEDGVNILTNGLGDPKPVPFPASVSVPAPNQVSVSNTLPFTSTSTSAFDTLDGGDGTFGALDLEVWDAESLVPTTWPTLDDNILFNSNAPEMF